MPSSIDETQLDIKLDDCAQHTTLHYTKVLSLLNTS